MKCHTGRRGSFYSFFFSFVCLLCACAKAEGGARAIYYNNYLVFLYYLNKTKKNHHLSLFLCPRCQTCVCSTAAERLGLGVLTYPNAMFAISLSLSLSSAIILNIGVLQNENVRLSAAPGFLLLFFFFFFHRLNAPYLSLSFYPSSPTLSPTRLARWYIIIKLHPFTRALKR